MRWTTNKPTVPGWYWWRSNNGFIAVCYIEPGAHDSCVSLAYGERYRLMSSMPGEWSDQPLTPPNEVQP